MAATATLQDNFNDNSLSANWSNYGGTNVKEQNQQLEITTNVSAAGAYFGLNSVSAYDLTGSYALVEVKDAGNQSLVSLDVGFTVEKDDLTGDEQAVIFIENGTLYLRRRTGGVNSDTTLTFNATTHRWWRIRESGGTIFLDTSQDGITWTNRRSFADPFTNKASLKISFFVGTWNSEASATTAIFDNMNTPPSAVKRSSLSLLGVG